MNVNKIANLRNIYTIDLLKSMFSRSQSIEFYSCLMNSSYVLKKDSLISVLYVLVKMYRLFYIC